MPGWVLGPNPGSLIQAPPVYALFAPPLRRVAMTLRSMLTPGLWATAWSPLRTRYSDAARSFSQRQPMRHDQDVQRPPPSPEESPRPRIPASHGLLQGPP